MVPDIFRTVGNVTLDVARDDGRRPRRRETPQAERSLTAVRPFAERPSSLLSDRRTAAALVEQRDDSGRH